MKIALIATADILTLLENFKKDNIDFYLPDNIYNNKILVGSNIKINKSYIESNIVGENKGIIYYKTQNLFKIYSYYYKIKLNFPKINFTKKEYLKLLSYYDKILLSLPNNFVFKTKTSGVYFYNTLRADGERKPFATFYSSFINKVASFSNGKFISSYFLEPTKKSIKILVIKKAEVKKHPDKIIILNSENDNDKIILNYRKETNA